MHKCKKCGQEKDIAEFYKTSLKCKSCFKEYYNSNKAKIANREKQYRSVPSVKLARNQRKSELRAERKGVLPYRINEKTYNDLLIEQNNCCAICKTHDSLRVDHDHKTGVVRGLLCNNCNLGIGLLKDNIEIFNNAIDYLTKFL